MSLKSMILVASLGLLGGLALHAQAGQTLSAELPAANGTERTNHYWTGAASTSWNHAGNWNPAYVPDSDSDVCINPNLPYYPRLSNLSPTVHTLWIAEGASLTLLTGGNLHVSDWADIQGQLSISAAVDLDVEGNINWFNGSSANISNSSAEIYCGGNMFFYSGSNVQLLTGYLQFDGNTDTQLVNYSANTRLNTLRVMKTDPGILSISSSCTSDLIIRGNLNNYEGSETYCHYTGNLVLWGNLRDYNTTAGRGLRWGSGTLILDGDNQELRFDSADAYLANLSVSCMGTASLATDARITGNLSLESGFLSAQGHTLSVGGQWDNTEASGDFIPGNGTVVFNQAGGTQYISGSNTFYNVTNNHMGGFLQFQGPTTVQGTLAVNQAVLFNDDATLNIVRNITSGGVLNFGYNNNATIASYYGSAVLAALSGTHVIVQDLADNGIFSYLQVSGGRIEIHQDELQYADVNNDILITQDGSIDIYGGSTEVYVGFAGDSTITMDSGELNIYDQNLVIPLTSSHAIDFIISGGTIRCFRGWSDNRGNFDPTGGTVEFAGSVDCLVTPHDGSWFWKLKVDKSPRRAEGPEFTRHRDGSVTPLTRSSTVTLTGNLSCEGTEPNVIENGRLELNGHVWTSAGQVDILDGGVLDCDPYSGLYMSNMKVLYVRSGGRLQAIGANTAWVNFSHNAAGYWGLSVLNGGTIAADNCSFEYLDSNGLYMAPGSLVDTAHAFTNCSFANGVAGGTLLTINNSQTFTVAGAYFNRNTPGSAYNVAKNFDYGQVYFSNSNGNFSGHGYENDAYNRIWWSDGSGIPPLEDLWVSYVPATNQIRLEWSYPFPADAFRIYRSSYPEGPFTYVGPVYPPSTSWSETVPGDRYFYFVKAVGP